MGWICPVGHSLPTLGPCDWLWSLESAGQTWGKEDGCVVEESGDKLEPTDDLQPVSASRCLRGFNSIMWESCRRSDAFHHRARPIICPKDWKNWRGSQWELELLLVWQQISDNRHGLQGCLVSCSDLLSAKGIRILQQFNHPKLMQKGLLRHMLSWSNMGKEILRESILV